MKVTSHFTIEDERKDVEPGNLVEIPPGVKYTYSGEMKLLLIMQPPWFEGNEEIKGKNPDVFED